jgi:hypothetical protein
MPSKERNDAPVLIFAFRICSLDPGKEPHTRHKLAPTIPSKKIRSHDLSTGQRGILPNTRFALSRPLEIPRGTIGKWLKTHSQDLKYLESRFTP